MSASSSQEETVQLRLTGLADVKYLLDFCGMLVSDFPYGKCLELDLLVNPGWDTAQVLVAEFQITIPRMVCQTLEQCRKSRSSVFFSHRLVTAELGGGGVSMFPYQEETLERTLSVAGGIENGPGMEVVVVAVHRADFGGNECMSGLAAAMTLEMLEEAWWGGDIC
ncbi:predicted protein [Postia placenta Mad-698-R]|uniref:Uncharacterized protein n=1 Tax=Postia placenta MAD-698-R-SB12 TaxID=670580 RepID=A0A1X6N1G4_9APHY|nr:hypothetical protein POSPLADRAFT_1142519 [Postia placenta MAD-698-R-SB12]EED80287.1 predicted protein [Postia placenta Mad-698-R]OSX62434.1 hypothetical protein POSPLADRAFT_1142519 [Postia placenta MAD-698-R-SB12]